MHVSLDLNLNWFVQLVVTTVIVGVGLGLQKLSKYYIRRRMGEPEPEPEPPCAVCPNFATKRCSACKFISYCSQACQRSHWISEHKAKCNRLKFTPKQTKDSSPDVVHHSPKILFPYDEFLQLFGWESPGFPPCGLLNCGNSCFANVVLQCLAYTKPLVAYLLVKGHGRKCKRNDWCFLCEFQKHLERIAQSSHPFSPINILSRLPNIGGNLGHGSQEDAHEFMRFAIDTMQSVCLDEFGGEKVVHPRSQETTLIQHIFGGQLQSQVICTKCNNISNQLENMMDLTVEIQGDAVSLEECLDQFTAKEWLHGENMYKCDRCNEYVTAWKRLSVRLPPNILTIALKRFQSGRFGKLNKRVTFPETVDLSPYMSKAEGDNDIYKLYAVIVHVDMLNASFFGHYICYVKDFRGQWYRIDDCKVDKVDLDEVLSQGAYMLLYSRARARPRCTDTLELSGSEIKNCIEHNEESPSSAEQPAVECPSVVPEDLNTIGHSDSSAVTITFPDVSAHSSNSSEDVMETMAKVDPGATLVVKNDAGAGVSDEGSCIVDEIAIALTQDSTGIAQSSCDPSLSCKSIEKDDSVADTVLVSDVEENKSEGSVEDTAFAVGTGKAEITSGKPGNREHLTSSSGSPEVARKCNGTDNSGLKLKPLFSPGFLGKQQQKKCIKRTADLLEKQPKPSSSGLCCTLSNGFVDSNVPGQDNSITDKKDPYTEASSNNISKCTNMVDVDCAGQQAGGDSGNLEIPIISMTDKNILVKELVEEKPDPW